MKVIGTYIFDDRTIIKEEEIEMTYTLTEAEQAALKRAQLKSVKITYALTEADKKMIRKKG